MLFQRTYEGFSPADKEASDWHYKTKQGALVELKGNRPRNPQHHRKFFALMNIVVDNSDDYDTVEQFRFVLMATLQRGKWIEVPHATRAMFIPESISFKSMKQEDFDRLYNDAMNAILKHFLPVDRQDLIEMIALA
ncbi:MAG: hypothetical protein COB09_17010 [Thalassobium sp.]|nr:MAG: hypothetical protein COB09_17010 [Thalassobium sp.]